MENVTNFLGNHHRYIAGGLSGIIEVFFTHPIDYLKTKKQEYAQNGYNNNFYKNLMKEPNLNLYRGVIPRLLGVTPMRLTFWGVQDNMNCYLANNHKNLELYQSKLISGSVAGTFQTLIDNPIELLKIQSMTNQKINYSDLFNNYGLRSTLSRNVSFAVCVSLATLGIENNAKQSDFKNFCYGAIGGAIGSVLTQPLDYVKTLSQRTKSHLPIFKTIIETYKESPINLYTGGTNRMLQSFLSMGIGYVAFVNFNRIICEL